MYQDLATSPRTSRGIVSLRFARLGVALLRPALGDDGGMAEAAGRFERVGLATQPFHPPRCRSTQQSAARWVA